MTEMMIMGHLNPQNGTILIKRAKKYINLSLLNLIIAHFISLQNSFNTLLLSSTTINLVVWEKWVTFVG